MSSHLARRGGIWWARLAVPERLRHAAGKREFTQSTKTHELHIAKMVAAVLVASWRSQLFALESNVMSSDVLRLIQANPILSSGGHVTIANAAAAIGIDREQLLRSAEDRQLTLFARLTRVAGHVLPWVDLERDNPAVGVAGGVLVPPPSQMPESAVETVFTGLAALPDGVQLAAAVLCEGLCSLDLQLFEVPNQPRMVFVASKEQAVEVNALEVEAVRVEELQKRLVKKLTRGQIERAVGAMNTPATAVQTGKHLDMLFSDALKVYSEDATGLPANIVSKTEQKQRRKGCMLLAEFMGDMPLGQITDHKLRAFRDGPLTTLPANANHLPQSVKRATMPETVAAIQVAGMDWPVLSPEMQRERMQWLNRMFSWLKSKNFINQNPCAGLIDEQTLTAAERKEVQRVKRIKDDDDEEGRPPFTPEELKLIFSQRQYQTGRGDHVKGNEVWYPFQYWLPLLGLFGGLRIKEASQLHLSDVRQDDSGCWYLDINEATPDKSLKNDASWRKVPLHPLLTDFGFLEYCQRLKAEGFRRVFPELTYSLSDARYAKESKRKMSAMLKKLGMPRDSTKVFHCLRHNINDAMQRRSALALPGAEDAFRTYVRYRLLGHTVEKTANVKHYTSYSVTEGLAVLSAVEFDLPLIAPLDIDFALRQILMALEKKEDFRHGREDMGPLNPVPVA